MTEPNEVADWVHENLVNENVDIVRAAVIRGIARYMDNEEDCEHPYPDRFAHVLQLGCSTAAIILAGCLIDTIMRSKASDTPQEETQEMVDSMVKMVHDHIDDMTDNAMKEFLDTQKEDD